MKKSIFTVMVLSVVLAVLGSVSVCAKDKLPAVNEAGMQLLEDSDLAAVYADPDADLGLYQRVWLEDATVSFKKNWKRDQNRSYPFKVDDKDMDRIRNEVATNFRDVMTKELLDGGYIMATAPADDVLKIVPAIVDLDVIAPDVQKVKRSYSYSESAGEMTLNLDLYDSVTNDKIVMAIDRKRDYRRGYFEWRTSVSNRADSRRMMTAWAKSIRSTLDEARKVVKTTG